LVAGNGIKAAGADTSAMFFVVATLSDSEATLEARLLKSLPASLGYISPKLRQYLI
jgi:hypothetical protein